MTTPREKFQKLLRELFQFECADLDFGIYRIMNHKRAVIEQFIEKDLLNAVSEELQKGALAQEANYAERLTEITAQIKDTLGADALDVEGNLSPNYAGTKIGKEYLSLQQTAGQAKNQSELESQIFNHLYGFFSRYYDQGDFMSLRRYSKREKYAIPYNGEEVYLHWANSDQYYIKTGENFTDYSYTHGNWTVRFKLRNADVEQNNVKGSKRFFIPKVDALELNAAIHELILPFEYRPLVSEDETKFGKTRVQEAIIVDALPRILSKAKSDTDALAALAHEKRRDAENNPVGLLEHHLRTYTQKNSRDFFIHKDLKGFLKRELDFYLKNEVLNLDELEAVGQKRSKAWFELLRIIKSIGQKIIAFVSQIEQFQKRLFEKKKFVLKVGYCVTLDRIPPALYKKIFSCKDQIAEWQKLYRIEAIEQNLEDPTPAVSLSIDSLKSNSFMVVDTKFYEQDFIESMLASPEILGSASSLDDATDGVLIRSDNYQALRLLRAKYRQGMSCIHIDPPYNTQSSAFLYKNAYQHSSWLSLMAQVTAEALHFLADMGSYLCHIDENEYERLHMLLEMYELPAAGTIVWDKRNPMLGGTGIATQHEYVIWRTLMFGPLFLNNRTLVAILQKAKEIIEASGGVNENSRAAFAKWIANSKELTGGEKAYHFLNDDGRVYQSVALGAPERRLDPKFHIPLMHPRTDKACPVPSNGWSRTPEKLQELLDRNEIIFGDDESVQPRRKVFLTDNSRRQIPSVIQDASRGKMDMEKLGLEFSYNHPVSLYETLLGAALADQNSCVLDFFAGSGTNGHAVISLNRKDHGRRKYVLVEVGEHFETVLKDRIARVVYAEEWKGGFPQNRNSGVSQVIKYFELESYEDSLANIAFSETANQPLFQLDDYALSYMLDFETKDSETFLNVSKLASPFDYKLHRHGTDEPMPVDLPETFNYLIGLHVRTRRIYEQKSTRYLVYRGISKERETVIIWRTTRGWGQKEFEADRKFIEKEKLIEGAEDIFVNTDSFVSGAHSLDPVFKRLMFNEE
jgi:adenine-specific DNA-methyltransferase